MPTTPRHPLIDYVIYLADNALIMGHRNSEWCGHGPILEQDIAITNLSLDLIGQARSFYQYAAELINQSAEPTAYSSLHDAAGGTVTEDSLAYLRDVRAFRNCLLTEQPNGDWGQTILRQFFFSAYQSALYRQLQHSADETLAAIAAKSSREVAYHLRWSSEWVIRLGDGTEESHGRMEAALTHLWPYTGELTSPADFETAGGTHPELLKKEWKERVEEIFHEATLLMPPDNIYMHQGGKTGNHSEHLGYILAELQFLQRAYPGCEW